MSNVLHSFLWLIGAIIGFYGGSKGGELLIRSGVAHKYVVLLTFILIFLLMGAMAIAVLLDNTYIGVFLMGATFGVAIWLIVLISDKQIFLKENAKENAKGSHPNN